jgi:Protein involved in formate dehydrogenase formation
MTQSIVSSSFEEELKVLTDLNLAYISAEDMARYQTLLTVQSKIYQATDTLNLSKITGSFQDLELSRGIPLVDPGVLAYPDAWAKTTLAQVAAVLLDMEQNESDVEDLIESLFSKAEVPFGDFMKWPVDPDVSIHSDQLEDLSGISEDTLRLLALESIRPVYWKLAESAIGKDTYPDWSFGHCPVCGSKPDMAYLESDEGNKFLVCSLCNHAWRFPRLKCAYCDNKDEKKLKYIITPDEEWFRIDVCDVCKGYLKTIDTRKWGFSRNLFPRVEKVIMLHLDALAEREGFTASPVLH